MSRELVPDVIVIRLPATLGVLQFDADWDDISEAYVAARDSARKAIEGSARLRPEEVRNALVNFLAEMRGRLGAVGARDPENTPRLLRACLFRRLGHHSLVVVHSCHMDDDADDRMSVDVESPGVGTSFTSKTSVLVKLGLSGDGKASYMTKYERAMVRPGLVNALCIPVFWDPEQWSKPPAERAVPLGVLRIDSDDDFTSATNDRDFALWLATQSTTLRTHL